MSPSGRAQFALEVPKYFVESCRESNPSVLCLLYFASVLLRRGTVEVKSNSEQTAGTAFLLTVAVTHRRAVWPDLREDLSQVFRLHRSTLFLCVVCCGEGFVFVSPTQVVSFHFDFWEGGSLLLSIQIQIQMRLWKQVATLTSGES